MLLEQNIHLSIFSNHIGAFPLSDLSLMTDEERERFLPVIRTFVSVLEKDTIDHHEINELIRLAKDLQDSVPEDWRALILDSLERGFGLSAPANRNPYILPSEYIPGTRFYIRDKSLLGLGYIYGQL